MIRLARRFSSQQEVLFNFKSGVLSVQLNRAKALNALNRPMIEAIHSRLGASQPSLVFLTGKGRAFCAGGDVKGLLSHPKGDKPSEQDEVVRFFRSQYSLDAALSLGQKYYTVSFMRGITMGGGFGLTSQNSLKIVSAETIFAMPENKLGLFPDVGAVASLAKVKSGYGKYLALTGATISGKEMVQFGLADVLVEGKDEVQQLEKGMEDCDPHVLVRLGIERRRRAGLEPIQLDPVICKAFSNETASQVMEQLRKHSDHKLAKEALAVLESLCPFSLAVTNEMFERSKNMSYKQRLVEDFRLAVHLTYRKDFAEGVKSVLIDKGATKPNWTHKSLSEVTKAEVETAFKPFSERGDKIAELQPSIQVDYY